MGNALHSAENAFCGLGSAGFAPGRLGRPCRLNGLGSTLVSCSLVPETVTLGNEDFLVDVRTEYPARRRVS